MVQPTPYDGSSEPFTIGLKPLDLADWLDVDATFDAQLAEKRRLYAEIPDKVFVEEPDTRAAQQEVLDLIEAHLAEAGAASPPPLTPPRKGEGDSETLTPPSPLRGGVRGGGTSPDNGGGQCNTPPLVAASLLVQEDLILMRKGEDGWRLAAGSLCFPSSWTLTEKFGLPIHEIHRPVPDFGAGSRNNELITRMFDRLHQPVLRWNWSIQAGGALYHPLSNAGREERATTRPSRFGDADVNAAAFIRVERQTLRKLPLSGDILFTIRIYLDPLGWIVRHPDRAPIAQSFARQLMALDAAQLDYKGLTADRNRLVAALEAIADG